MEHVYLALAAAIAVGISAVATAWVQSRIGAAGAGALAEKPELTATVIILLAIPETIVILGFVVAAMMTFSTATSFQRRSESSLRRRVRAPPYPDSAKGRYGAPPSS